MLRTQDARKQGQKWGAIEMGSRERGAAAALKSDAVKQGNAAVIYFTAECADRVLVEVFVKKNYRSTQNHAACSWIVAK